MARGMQAAAAALLTLQRTGPSLAEAAQSRALVVAQMEAYLRTMGLDAGALPPVIHIAGTKGKGSTAAMCESMLRAGGMRTALYSSPHLVTVRERFRLDGRPVPEPMYLRHFWATWDALRAGGSGNGGGSGGAATAPTAAHMPGYFHFLTLLAFRIFRDERVDVAVLEVGLGGRLDATNVVPAPVACGITTLDFDHTEVLGDTLPLIAREKAGIFKRGAPALSVPQRADALAVLREEATAAGAAGPLRIVDAAGLEARARAGGAEAFPVLGLDGGFQRTNAALAVALAEEFFAWRRRRRLAGGEAAAPAPAGLPAAAATDATGALLPEPRPDATPEVAASPLSLPDWAVVGLRTAQWPGRAQTLPFAPNATLYVDGAHTERSLRLCVQWFRERVRVAAAAGAGAEACVSDSVAVGPPAPARLVLVFYCGAEKDALQLLLPLSALHFDRAVFTAPDWVRPSRHAQPTAAEALASFRSRRERAGDAEAVADLDAAAAAAAVAVPVRGQDGAVVAGAAAVASAPPSAAAAAWPVALAELWAAAHADPQLARLRARLAQPPPDYDAGAAAGDEARGRGAVEVLSSPLPRQAPPTAVVASVTTALADVRALAAAEPSAHHHVLVTGSLYLVGAVLEAVGFEV